jgi:hypothetical protein
VEAGAVTSRKKRDAETLIKKLARLLDIPVQVTSSERGRRFEQYCAKKCRELRFQVIDHSHKQKPYDLLVNGFRVQCKARNKHGNNRTGVNLSKNNQKRYVASDVDFFVIRFAKKCFVIPSSVIADRSGHVRAWVRLNNKKHFIDAWDQLLGRPVYAETQMSFLEGRG